MNVTGKFEVELKPMETHAQGKDEINLGRMSIDNIFSGELDASSRGEMLTAMTPVQVQAKYP